MSNHVLIDPDPFFRFSTNIPSELTLAKDMKYQSFSNPYLDHYCISKCSEKKETNKIYEESCKTFLTRQTSLLVVFFFATVHATTVNRTKFEFVQQRTQGLFVSLRNWKFETIRIKKKKKKHICDMLWHRRSITYRDMHAYLSLRCCTYFSRLLEMKQVNKRDNVSK